MSAPIISIIVPVYNAAKTVEACVRSILKQDFADWELLLVNDGSADNSLSIIEKLAKTDPRIKVIDREHSGVSDTRNRALEIMQGEYVCFIDADDEIESNYLSSFYAEREYDMVISGYVVDELTQDGAIIKSTTYKPDYLEIKRLLTNREKLKPLFLNGMININCNKLLKADIIRKHNLRYKPIPVNEDFYFMLEYLGFADSVCTITSTSYHWKRINGLKTGVDSIPEDLINIYTQAHENIISYFGKDLPAHEVMYNSYYFVALKYCNAIVNNVVDRREGYKKLKELMNDELVRASFKTRKKASRGELLLNFLLTHKLFTGFLMLNKHLGTVKLIARYG